MIVIDLHVHTNCSDGYFSPHDLIQLAAQKGLRAMSITDHDTIKAYDLDIIYFADQLGIKLIPGIEFSTIDEVSNEKIHVLGLNLDVNNVDLKTVCEKIYQFRQDVVLLTEAKLRQVGIILRSNDLLKSGAVMTKSHIAKDVIDNPINKAILFEIYGKIPMQGVFIEDYLIKNKPAFIESRDKFTTSQAVQIIQQAGGKAFCAHPSFNVMRGYDFGNMKQLILRNKFDGVEVINIQYDKSNGDKRFDMVSEFTDFAECNNLLTSGGSDFHSNDYELLGNHSDLGLENEGYKVNDQQLAMIIGK